MEKSAASCRDGRPATLNRPVGASSPPLPPSNSNHDGVYVFNSTSAESKASQRRFDQLTDPTETKPA